MPAPFDVARTQSQSPQTQEIYSLGLRDRFMAALKEIAADLVYLREPLLPDQFQNQPEVAARYSRLWKEMKEYAGESEEIIKAAKSELRSLGGQHIFVDTLRMFIEPGLPNSKFDQDDMIMRFRIALRLAMHLSPDGGKEVCCKLDRLLYPQYGNTAPLYLVKAYQGYLASKTMPNWLDRSQMLPLADEALPPLLPSATSRE
jgi:hypothetical protein